MTPVTATMLGVTKLAPGDGNVSLAEREVRAPGPGDVAVDVRAVGICGTDLHIQRGEYPSVPPVTIGHEVCGIVAEAGDGVDPAWITRRVVVETFASTCGRCPHCRDGRLSICPTAGRSGRTWTGAWHRTSCCPRATSTGSPPS